MYFHCYFDVSWLGSLKSVMVEIGSAEGFPMIRSKNPWKCLWRTSWIFQIVWNKNNRMSSLGSRVFCPKFDKMQHPKRNQNHLWSKMAWRKGFGWSNQKILQNTSGGPLEPSKTFGIKWIAWVVLAPEFFAQNSTKCHGSDILGQNIRFHRISPQPL